ncbi:MAG: hypothetical protein ACKVIF_08430 [Rhodospirillales bacterium]|jgi:hypothetical protein
MYWAAVGAEPEIANPLHTESCDFFYLAPEVGLEPKAENIVKPEENLNCAKFAKLAASLGQD